MGDYYFYPSSHFSISLLRTEYGVPRQSTLYQNPAQVEGYHTGLLRTPAPAPAAKTRNWGISGKDHNPGAD